MKENKIFKSKEDVKQTLDNVNSWINNYDTKVSIILGVVGVIVSLLLSFDYIGIVYKIMLKLLESMNIFSIASVLIILFSIILLIIGIVFLVKILLAKINLQDINKNEFTKDSILFFSSISKNKDFSTYKKKVASYTEEDWLNDYISQIYICSIICDTKFKTYKIGLLCSCTGVGILLCWICINYFFVY